MNYIKTEISKINLLGCDTMKFNGYEPIFWGNFLPPSSLFYSEEKNINLQTSGYPSTHLHGFTWQIIILLLLTANGFSPGGSGTTIRQQTNNTLTTIRQHTI
jgi:hypothetical protein